MTTDNSTAERRATMLAQELAMFSQFDHLSTRSGPFRAFRSVQALIRQVANDVRNIPCKLRTIRLLLWILRMHGSPRMLRDRRDFYLDTRKMASIAELGMSRQMIRTSLEKLAAIPVTMGPDTFCLIERAPLINGGSKHVQTFLGDIHRKPILWRFSAGFVQACLRRIHEWQRRRSRQPTCIVPADSCSEKTSIIVGHRESQYKADSKTLHMGYGLASKAPSPVRMLADSLGSRVSTALDRIADIFVARSSGKAAECPSLIGEDVGCGDLVSAAGEAPTRRSAAEIALSRLRRRGETIVQRMGVATDDDRLNAIFRRVGI